MGVVDDVVTRMQAQSLVDGATGWTSSKRKMHDGSNQLVVVTEDGGPPPELHASQGIGSEALKQPAVQILVRGEPNKGNDTYTKARAIFDDLNHLLDVTINSTTYLSILSRTSEPVFTGFDDNERPIISMSFLMLTSAG